MNDETQQHPEAGTVIHTNDDGSTIVWDGEKKVTVPAPDAESVTAETPEEKAEIAFSDMTARDHRKAAFHMLLCPSHGAAILLNGMSTGNVSAVKVDNLTTAKERVTEALAHIEAALTAYTDSET